MKKNTMMRLAAVMLMCVLLTTSVVGGTFAKYVKSDSDTDIARVAKWGVNVEVVVAGAFATEYNANSTVNDHNGNVIANTVVSADNSKNVLAPGTNGDLLKKATISGTPEVAVNVKKEATLTLTGWEIWDSNEYYCPITIKVTHKVGDNAATTQTFYGLTYNSAADFTKAVEAALDANYNLPANSNLAESYSITWAWAFEGEGTDDKQTDVKDTALGDKAAKTSDITIDFKYEITVTQVD